ncbi:MAG TPA: DEAD/DEAH box helicase, partial [Gammaproteobacteria bacterium]|nr:DEAD/DEAH box helicase [Gammaproteobacteria bacterium]
TGKTAAFALPLLTRLDVSLKQPQVLVLAPTRELAIQVAEAFQGYARHLKDFHILPVYGGQDMGTQLRQLKRGVQVVVGTPGRVMDHLRRKSLKLDNLISLVLDEADEMLKMGFIDDVEWILEQAPEKRQIALFSATMPPVIRRIAQRHLHDPVEIKIKTKTTTVDTITQQYWQVTGTHKLDALTRILEVEPFDAMIIFVRTKNATVELAEKLEARGYSSGPLNGDMNQALREKTIDRLKKKSLDIVVATDVAARGIDVERVSHVVNYDIPYDTEAYVHRIGRTGRAGRQGKAILFVAPREKRMLRAIEKATRQVIKPIQLPTREDVANRRVAQFKELISETIESQELDYFEQLIEQYQSEHNVGISEIAAALAWLVQRERPLVVKEKQIPRNSDSREQRSSRPRQGETREQYRDRPASRSSSAVAKGMVRYRIDVGREHGVQPKNIVGAIANEAGVDSQHIGHIKLHDTYSTVDLPEGMPKEIFTHLKKVWVCNQKLNITVAGGESPAPKKRSKPKGKAVDKGKKKIRKVVNEKKRKKISLKKKIDS